MDGFTRKGGIKVSASTHESHSRGAIFTMSTLLGTSGNSLTSFLPLSICLGGLVNNHGMVEYGLDLPVKPDGAVHLVDRIKPKEPGEAYLGSHFLCYGVDTMASAE